MSFKMMKVLNLLLKYLLFYDPRWSQDQKKKKKKKKRPTFKEVINDLVTKGASDRTAFKTD